MKYHFKEIEAKWQKYWAENQTFKAENHTDKEKFYVLDMFPYPSGAGLHVGHPLGYIASDIVARYKRHQGFNVLHPQGYDSFGLPAEQYAIQTGQHPAITTETNIKRYREQLDKIGFSFDWSREVRTSEPDYYKWTQWIFIQLFNSYYCKDSDQARSIDELIMVFETEGNYRINAVCDDDISVFSADEWNAFSSEEKQRILLKYRLTYLAETEVNWCPALGTVLANDEIVNGVSERGGHPVIRKKMTQWSMRISAYAERLLQGLETIDWTESLKESQRNWIGKSVGAEVTFNILPLTPSKGGGTPGYLTGKAEKIDMLLSKAKEMRKEPTVAEEKLWQQLRNRKLEYKFRRQHPIDTFIVDFVCLEKKLIIEVDGGIHKKQREKDESRQLLLEEKKGFSVLRFTNEEVMSDIKSVLNKIDYELKVRPSYRENKTPLSFGEGLGVRKTPSPLEKAGVRIFTTRPDTIFGVSFMTLAPEHELVAQITTPEQKQAVEAYVEATAKRSERERMADVKTISGVFTGAYAEHPFTKEPIPIWIGDYVLAGYGTGAVMAVPCGDERDYAFAKHFGIEIKQIFKLNSSDAERSRSIEEQAFTEKGGFEYINSDFLNGLDYKSGTKKIIEELEKIGAGKAKVNYRLRDAVFSRQRYWGEPFPVYYVNGLPQMIEDKYLPIRLPEVEKYLPTEDGQPPLGNAKEWYWNTKTNRVCSPPSEGLGEDIFPLELNTMPGWAGSSWYWLRYMDAKNENEFASEEAINYWKNVDLYIGGSEHATGHLLYSRFWNKFLKDKGLVPTEEPFQKLINQGMILGMSAFVYNYPIIDSEIRYIGNNETPESYEKAKKDYTLLTKIKRLVPKSYYDNRYNLSETQKSIIEKLNLEHKNKFEKENPKYQLLIGKDIGDISSYCHPVRIDISLINELTNELDIEKFKAHPLYAGYKDAIFILDNGNIYDSNSPSFGGGKGEEFTVHREVEKMSKSKYNVVNPDDICEEYGADTLRLYEMFLGPLEQAKPWNTAGITGVHSFLKKLWKLYHNGKDESFFVSEETPSKEALKTLHKTIKKVIEDIENFSFNTSVSTFMICVNELSQQKCNHRAILEPLVVLISPYAPHIAEELWQKLGHNESIAYAPFPKFEEKYLVESSKEYPVSFNGKMRFTLELPLDMPVEEIEKAVMSHEKTQQYLEGRTPKKVIIVPGKIINLVG